MIIKGTSRGSPKQLAAHLQRADTNERVEVLELNAPTDDLADTLRDWQFLASGTNGIKGLYHANISPDAGYPMTPEQWERSVNVLEKELGLTGQPRVVVLHEKDGRQHIHVVWQRTDVDTMTLKTDSNNYAAHERASMALEQEFGHEHVPGKHAKRDRENQPDFPQSETNHAEWQQSERSGLDPRERKEAITALFRQCDNGQAFKAALEEQGYILAQGDRRDYVLVDPAGEVHSLGRQVKDVKAKELREFMADIDREALPTVKEAKALQQAPRPTEAPEQAAPEPCMAGDGAMQPQPTAETPPEPPKPSQEDLARIEAALKARHEEEGRKLQERQEAERRRIIEIFNDETAGKLEALKQMQEAALARYDREHSPPKGLDAFFTLVKSWINPEQEREKAAQREQARAGFIKQQEKDRAGRLSQWNNVKDQDIADTIERHAQQQREHAGRYRKELERYAREHEAAQRLLAEMEKQRLQQEKERYGPEPPKPSL